jgi:hypothetical protein
MTMWATMHLVCLVLIWLQFFFIRQALREVSWLRQFAGIPSKSPSRHRLKGLTAGTPVPHFVGSVLGSGTKFTNRHLKGSPSILLFIEPAPDDSGLYRRLALVVGQLSDRVDGNLYLVCSAPREKCQFLQSVITAHLATLGDSANFAIIEDPHSLISRAFVVERLPAGVRIGENGLIEQYGFPLEVVESEIPSFTKLQEVNHHD